MTNASSDVRDAWEENVLLDVTIQGYTDKVYTYDVSQDSQFDAANLRSDADGEGPRVNFFICLVQRRQEPQLVGSTRYTFSVTLEYYLEQSDQPQSTYNTLVDRLEAADDLVRTALGVSWGGTVDFYQGGVPQRVTQVTIDERACWKGGFTYTATKTT